MSYYLGFWLVVWSIYGIISSPIPCPFGLGFISGSLGTLIVLLFIAFEESRRHK